MKTKILSAFLSCVVVTGCASGPYAIIDGSRPSLSKNSNAHQVIISGVNGKIHFDNRRWRKVEPGFNMFRVSSAKGRNTNGTEISRNFLITAQPCMRYYIAAEHEPELDSKNWEIKILKEEPIGECVIE